ncbi:MAG: hypothetical protein C4523_05610 [Myxococcales bacterium]|nr:MAG: hypothetical protein C4523_05610 [Myxococcales bacterium]
MKTPIYKRKWFLVGVAMIFIGAFTTLYSGHVLAKYESLYPELAKDETSRFLDRVQNEDGIPPKLNAEEAEAKARATYVHELYGVYVYTGYVLAGLGLVAMALSTREPQVPTIEDIEKAEADSKST